jgi:uncharacterized membrane protein YfcA
MHETLDTVSWTAYRRVKKRLLILLAGWLPFGFLVGWPLPYLLHSYMPTYVLALAYALFLLYSWLTYAFFSCPNCGNALRGRQLYRKTCPNCGTKINA